MKSACIFLLSLVCLIVSVNSYGGRRIDPLREIIRAQMTKRSSTYYVSEDDTALVKDYSPVYVGSQDGLKEADKITDMPGQPEVSFSQYSGYVTVDPNAGRALFYYFTESADSSPKPLVLVFDFNCKFVMFQSRQSCWSVTDTLMQWAPLATNYAGPGCSSLGAGAMMELGPFRVNPDGKSLWHNENAWNSSDCKCYIPGIPSRSRFSYSNTSSDYTTGDKQTAADAYTFLINWLERFPEYKTRDFYITGESYAGHYVPQLAALILENNKMTNQTVINLKGIAIGNPLIDVDDNVNGAVDYFWTHALISDELHEALIQNCNFTPGAPESQACDDLVEELYEAIGDIYNYNIYAPLCNYSSLAPSDLIRAQNMYVHTYLNTPDVQKALHANVTGIPGPWANCSSFVDYSFEDFQATVLPTIQGLMATDISAWIYSGDTDSVCPVTGTRYSLEKIGGPVKTPWYPWYTQGEVGGYVVEYQNLTFVTVRGSGHFVPSYQPERALTMFASFLQGKLPPSES